jgi:uncharacterized protein YuzE
VETIKILENEPRLSWDYDEEADVLYITIGQPRSAVGVDIGEGIVVRYDEKRKEVVGITVIGFKAKTFKGIIK